MSTPRHDDVRAHACCTFALLLLSVLTATTSALALDTELATVTAGPAREDGFFGTYFVSFTVEGAEIAGGTIYKPGAPPTELCQLVFAGPGFLAPESWSCELEGFASLDEICTMVGFGDFRFELTAAAGADDAFTVSFDPGCVDPWDGYPQITAPSPGGVVPPVPGAGDFCWTCSVAGTCGDGNYAVAIADQATGDLDSDLFREIAVPACWDPGICVPPAPDHEFAVTALEFHADLVPETSDLGDEFLFLSAFESTNVTLFEVNDAPPATPPGVPGGEGVTAPMTAAKGAPDGSTLDLSWDAVSCCSITNHHLVWGTRADLPGALGGTYGLDGSRCALGAAGSYSWAGTPAPASGDFVWWLVLADDGATVEGSWRTDSAGNERSGPGAGGVSAQCGMTSKDVGNACGR